MNYKTLSLITLIILLSLLCNFVVFTKGDLYGWDAIFHAGHTKIIYNTGTATFHSPISFGTGGYNECPLMHYFTAYIARIFHFNIDLTIKYIPIFFLITTLIALYYFFELFIESKKYIYLGLICFALLSTPAHFSGMCFLVFTILSLYFTFNFRKVKYSYFLVGATAGISFLIHASTSVICGVVIVVYFVHVHYKNLRNLIKALTVIGIVYFSIVSITLIPTILEHELYDPLTKLKIGIETTKNVYIPTPIARVLPITYLDTILTSMKRIQIPNIFIFYRGLAILFLIPLYTIYIQRRKVMDLIVPFICLIVIGNITYFIGRPFFYLMLFSIPLTLIGIKNINSRKIKVILISLLLFYSSVSFIERSYLAVNCGMDEEKYREGSTYLQEGLILSDPETRFCLTYLIGSKQCYPLNLNLNKYDKTEKRELEKEILKCLVDENPELIERENISYIVINKTPDFSNLQITERLEYVSDFRERYITHNWDYLLIYEDENMKIYKVE